jgi:hypothetical protein
MKVMRNNVMIPFTRPMLAASLLPSNVEHTNENILVAMEKLKYPVIATLKKDGIRAIKLGELASRTLKRIPNISIQKRAEKIEKYIDMELFNPDLQYDEIESIVMSKEHPDSDKIEFHLLDYYTGYAPSMRYIDRLRSAMDWAISFRYEDVICPNTFLCHTPLELLNVFRSCEQQEGEGICFRTLNSPYKQGRSTLKEQYLIKLARFVRDELTITGFKEQMMNTNAEKRNALGYMNRRKTVGGVGKNTLGAFICKAKDGTTVDVGTGVGLTDKLRKDIWTNRDCYFGKQITIKHKPHGAKNKLRSPIFVGFREEGY